MAGPPEVTLPRTCTVLCNWNLWWKQNSLWWKQNSLSFPHLFHTNTPDGNLGETVLPHFPPFSPMWGKLISPSGNSVSPLGKRNSPIFPQFPPNPPDFMHITCTVSLKLRIPHYARQRIINLGNFGEIQVNSGEIKLEAFHFFFTPLWNTFPS